MYLDMHWAVFVIKSAFPFQMVPGSKTIWRGGGRLPTPGLKIPGDLGGWSQERAEFREGRNLRGIFMS